ncbi:GAMM1 protein [Ephemerocybe angulata]|uniref:GAMM1 protein n=1 Tax=Ephemerocybe angulata TaxID=980116 RepID=A0A8H6MH79_9AGAR|nr:GAMM1 protein [Tulosesus angulatus]
MSSTAAASTTESPQAKRQKVMPKVIGTHNGTFHCDEALAVYMLKLTDTYKDAEVVRTRDPAVLDTCDIVVDVGAVYDHAAKRYDHHQRGFEEVLGLGFNTKLSSAGLVYKHFGAEIIANKLSLPATDEKVTYIYSLLYRDFIEAIDAIDNGISQYPSSLTPAYRNRTDLSARVGRLNPRWNEPTSNDILDAKFQIASALAGGEFAEQLDFYATSWLPARDLTASLIAQSKEAFDKEGRVLVFEKFVPWKEHLFDLEESEGSGVAKGAATYVVYPDEAGGNWRIQAVPVAPQSFESRKALPEPWRGVRDEKLSELTAIPGGIFVHASGFIGGNKTREGAIEMAKKALEL